MNGSYLLLTWQTNIFRFLQSLIISDRQLCRELWCHFHFITKHNRFWAFSDIMTVLPTYPHNIHKGGAVNLWFFVFAANKQVSSTVFIELGVICVHSAFDIINGFFYSCTIQSMLISLIKQETWSQHEYIVNIDVESVYAVANMIATWIFIHVL